MTDQRRGEGLVASQYRDRAHGVRAPHRLEPACDAAHCPCCSPVLASRRAMLGLVAAASAVLVASRFTPAMAAASPDDENFMRMAIAEARQADFPFGAVIVRNGDVIARGRNRGREL